VDRLLDRSGLFDNLDIDLTGYLAMRGKKNHDHRGNKNTVEAGREDPGIKTV
jgi:hypothetical protein